MSSEAQAREQIDAQLIAAGWVIQRYKDFDPSIGPGIALTEVPVKIGTADYLLLVDKQPVGVIEAKKEGTPRVRRNNPNRNDIQIVHTLSGQFNREDLERLKQVFPLPWSHYGRLIRIKENAARQFYETEALRNGWSVRQLDRQIATRFYERTALSKNKAAMLQKGAIPQPSEIIAPEPSHQRPVHSRIPPVKRRVFRN